MRPGDVLYIPRGFYHDALASSSASLHVTFAVLPLTGRIIFQMLHDIAVEDEEFRQYLPDARVEGGAMLAATLGRLAERISQIGHSERFKTMVAVRQRQLWEPSFSFRLPEKEKLDFYARSEEPAQVFNRPDGATLSTRSGEFRLGQLSVAAEWLLTRPAFSLQELFARYRHLDEKDLRELIAKLESSGIFYPYKPELR
jgi:ribosomal protein L16 Arg81 hydroxylase